MKKKKIRLIVFPGFFLPHIGGVESHVDNFVKYLSKDKKYDITIFAPDIPVSKEKEIIHKRVKVIRYPAFEIVHNFPVPKVWDFRFWKLFFGLYKKKFDVVMTRTMFFSNSTLGMFFAKFRFFGWVKLVHVEHGSDFSKLDSGFKMFVNKFYILTLGKLLVSLSDSVVAVSDASREYLGKYVLSRKKLKDVRVVRRGFDYERCLEVEPDLKLKRKYKGKKLIVYVGRLIDGKGVQDVLKVLRGLDLKDDDYRFLIVGDGEYRKKLEKMVLDFGLSDKVVFLGRVSHDRVISIFKVCDVFVNPSYTEGLPTTVLDAFFSGTKVLATDVGGTYEILGEFWDLPRYELVKMKDLKAIRAGLLKLIYVKDKVGVEMDSVKLKFDWEEHAKAYDDVLVRVL